MPGPNTEVAKHQEQTPAVLFRQTLEKWRGDLEMALPQHIGVDRMMRTVMTSVRKNPKLLDCTQLSLFSAILTVAQLGLEPDDPRGLAHIIPFGGEAQVIIGYRGYIDLGRRSGDLSGIYAEVVYEKDFFQHELGLERKLVHRRYEGADDPGPLKCVYAVATLKDGYKEFRVLSRKQVERARSMSRNAKKEDSAWNTAEDEMWCKTAIRRLFKILPQSAEIALAQRVDDGGGIRVRRTDKSFEIEVVDQKDETVRQRLDPGEVKPKEGRVIDQAPIKQPDRPPVKEPEAAASDQGEAFDTKPDPDQDKRILAEQKKRIGQLVGDGDVTAEDLYEYVKLFCGARPTSNWTRGEATRFIQDVTSGALKDRLAGAGSEGA